MQLHPSAEPSPTRYEVVSVLRSSLNVMSLVEVRPIKKIPVV